MASQEEFKKAAQHVLMFGKFKTLPLNQRTLDAIASTDEGLKYLDWLRGALHEHCLDWQMETRAALDVYLDDPAIAKELKEASGPRTRCKTSYAQDHATRQRQAEMGF